MNKEDLFLKTILGQSGSGKSNAILALMQLCEVQFGKKLLYVYDGILYKKEESEKLLTYNMRGKTNKEFEKFIDDNKEKLVLVYIDESCSLTDEYITMLSMKGIGIANEIKQNLSKQEFNA